MSTDIILGSLTANLVPGDVEYAVLLPPGYDKTGESLTLLLNMHDSGLDRNYLASPKCRP